MSGLSNRGHLNLKQVVANIPKKILKPTADASVIDLSMAENHLIREEILQIVKSSIAGDLLSQHLDWPKGFYGDSDLLNHLAGFFDRWFRPYRPVRQEHLVVSPGAAACLDAVLYTICDSGDGVLVPTPYWGGYDVFFTSHSGVKPIGVDVADPEGSLEPALIDALEVAYQISECRIRALVLSNPHNPLGRCYSKQMLEKCVKFCRSHDIHLISDEVFAMSSFPSPDLPNAPKFTSLLNLKSELSNHPLEHVHVIWSMSKDFAASGIRLGCLVTRYNDLRDTVALITSAHVSTLSTVASKAILSYPGLPNLLELSSKRLAERYLTVTTFFKNTNIAYIPCNSASFLMAKLAPHAKSRGDEVNALFQYTQAGVFVAPGWAYHVNAIQRGWMRVSFAMSEESLLEGLKRVKMVYDQI